MFGTAPILLLTPGKARVRADCAGLDEIRKSIGRRRRDGCYGRGSRSRGPLAQSAIVRLQASSATARSGSAVAPRAGCCYGTGVEALASVPRRRPHCQAERQSRTRLPGSRRTRRQQTPRWSKRKSRSALTRQPLRTTSSTAVHRSAWHCRYPRRCGRRPARAASRYQRIKQTGRGVSYCADVGVAANDPCGHRSLSLSPKRRSIGRLEMPLPPAGSGPLGASGRPRRRDVFRCRNCSEGVASAWLDPAAETVVSRLNQKSGIRGRNGDKGELWCAPRDVPALVPNQQSRRL